MSITPNTLGSWANKFNKQYTTGGEWWKEGMEITPTMIKCFIGNLLAQDRKELVEKIEEYARVMQGNNPFPTVQQTVVEDVLEIINNHKAE